MEDELVVDLRPPAAVARLPLPRIEVEPPDLRRCVARACAAYPDPSPQRLRAGERMVDLDLIARARGGEETAFNRLAAGEIDRLYAIAYRILGRQDAAEDAVQETLVAVWRDLPRLRELGAFQGWMTRVLIHTCYREARRSRRLAVVPWTGERDSAHDDRSASIEDREQIDRAIRTLSAEHRAVVVVTHYLGLSGREAAGVLGIPQGTVKSRLHHATQALRAAMAAEDRVGERRSASRRDRAS